MKETKIDYQLLFCFLLGIFVGYIIKSFFVFIESFPLKSPFY